MRMPKVLAPHGKGAARMTRPTPTTAATVLFAIRLPREGWTMDRNGQLHIFNSHADALRRIQATGRGEIVPVEIGRAT